MSAKFKVEITSHVGDKPELIATVYWSEETGVVCDNAVVGDELSFGLAVPPRGEPIYAEAGRAFLYALKFEFSGIVRAGHPVECAEVKGDPVPALRGQSPWQGRRA